MPDEPEYDIKCEALLPVLRGELPVHFHAHRLDDIFTAQRHCEGIFAATMSIVHGTQGACGGGDLLAAGRRAGAAAVRCFVTAQNLNCGI